MEPDIYNLLIVICKERLININDGSVLQKFKGHQNNKAR